MKLNSIILALIIASCAVLTRADFYLHSNGCNNRLNERSATRANNNRLFDSQNNARGGINVGDKTSSPFNGKAPLKSLEEVYNPNLIGNGDETQYPLTFFENSILPLVWTNQHGCGGNGATDPHNLNCNLILQYACDTNNSKIKDLASQMNVRNGGNTNTPSPPPSNYDKINEAVTGNKDDNRGLHENEYYYFECSRRNRNTGIFTADQKLNGNTARNTRQNPNGDRSGLECPEERDYYPYWHPTPWVDIAYMTSELNQTNVNICELVQQESQNVKDKFKCVPAGTPNNENVNAFKYTNQQDCNANGGTWLNVPARGVKAPECIKAQWARDNHLGNTRDGQYQNYTWNLPSFSDLVGNLNFKSDDNNHVKCVMRGRYNMTTSDYDPWNTFSDSNNKLIHNNPTVDIGTINKQGLQLAINTAQTGRTFQDRSHVFTIKKRPSALKDAKIHNLYVVGKRGNIVQVYPAHEYYFVPNYLTVSTKDYIHIQWTGSNTHNNGPNGGDGQTGDDGQGQGGTDQNNFVLTMDGEGYNFPTALDKVKDHMWKHTTCYVPTYAGSLDTISTNFNNVDCALIFATGGQRRTAAAVTSGDAINAQLNDAPRSLVNGVLIKISKPGRYTYMSSRNNNFTNRSQKGVITVV